MKKRMILICVLMAAAVLLGGCGSDAGEEKVKDLEFTVVEEKSVPGELAKLIGYGVDLALQEGLALEDLEALLA